MKDLCVQFDPVSARIFRRALRFIVLALLLLGLGACNSTRLLYQNLDWLAFEAMDDRFDVRADQEGWVKATLDEIHQRHRVGHLPDYRETLGGLGLRYADGLDGEDLLWLDWRVEQHRRDLAKLVIPGLARFLADLDEEQLAHYVAAAEASIEEAAEQLGWSPQRRQAYRLETFVGRIERWTGDLTMAQIERLEADVAALPDIRREWIDYRRQRLEVLSGLLSARPGQTAIEAALHAWWLDLDAAHPEVYAAARRLLKQQVFGLLVRLDRHLTPGQRRRVAERLGDYVSTIDLVLASN